MRTVIVVGGGMAGVACASELADQDIQVTLIDRHDYTQFQPAKRRGADDAGPDVFKPGQLVCQTVYG